MLTLTLFDIFLLILSSYFAASIITPIIKLPLNLSKDGVFALTSLCSSIILFVLYIHIPSSIAIITLASITGGACLLKSTHNLANSILHSNTLRVQEFREISRLLDASIESKNDFYLQMMSQINKKPDKATPNQNEVKGATATHRNTTTKPPQNQVPIQVVTKDKVYTKNDLLKDASLNKMNLSKSLIDLLQSGDGKL